MIIPQEKWKILLLLAKEVEACKGCDHPSCRLAREILALTPSVWDMMHKFAQMEANGITAAEQADIEDMPIKKVRDLIRAYWAVISLPNELKKKKIEELSDTYTKRS
jgi:hypothetical protein